MLEKKKGNLSADGLFFKLGGDKGKQTIATCLFLLIHTWIYDL